jgi:valyl-tRNA synthetase (EC 6.1.1.9)
MPFITEEIWQRVVPLAGRSGETIMLAPYPVARPDRINAAAEADVDWMKRFILGVRQIRGEMDIPPGKVLPVLLSGADVTDRERAERLQASITFLARVEPPQRLADDAPEPPAATALLGEMKILVPMAGLIDKDAELARLAKLIGKIENDLARNLERLASDKFVNGAPAAVVDRERARVAQQQSELATLREQAERVRALA